MRRVAGYMFGFMKQTRAEGRDCTRCSLDPPAAELLGLVVAEVLEEEIVPALDGPAQHHARVAASLVAHRRARARLGDAAADRERDAWRRSSPASTPTT